MPSQEQKRQKNKKKTEIDKTSPAVRRKRHPFLYFGSVGLLVIIVVAFVGGPLVGRIGSNRAMVFGKYGGEEIKYVPGNYLDRQTEVLYDQMQDSSGQGYEYRAYQVWKGAFDRTVIHTAILQIADNAGVYISDNRIDELLLATGPYMENGVFSEAKYTKTPNSERFKYRRLYRDEYIQQTVIQDSLHLGIYSSKEADFLKTMAADERAFVYVLFGYSDYPGAEVAIYAEGNSSLFRKIKVSRITVKTSRDEAEAIRRQIVEGVATFEDQARNYSTDMYAEEGGDMGCSEDNALSADFANGPELEALFSLQKGDISGVFETSFGWVIYRADEAAVEPDLEDPEILNSIRTYMERFERGKIEDYLLANAEKFAAAVSESTITAAADVFGIEVKKTESFPINYGNAFYFGTVSAADDSQDLSSAAYDELFFSELFSLKEKQVSEPIVLTDSVGVFQLADLTPLSDEDVEFLHDYYPIIAQQNIEQDLNRFIFSSEDFEDYFTEVFSENFLN